MPSTLSELLNELAALVDDGSRDSYRLRYDLETEIAHARAREAGAVMEVKHSRCNNLYRYDDGQWTFTPRMAVMNWLRDAGHSS